MISKSELLQGRDAQYPDEYTPEISANLDSLLQVMNKIRTAYGQPMIVNSGWRPASINSTIPGAATHSAHCIGLACDIADPDGRVMVWALNNLSLLKDLGVYLEDFNWCPNWVHFGLKRPLSGRRIFIPNANRPLINRWDGVYPPLFDV